MKAMLLVLLLGAGIGVYAQDHRPTTPADKQADAKLTEVETLKLQVAQKDLVIAQLQEQILQLSQQVLQARTAEANSKMLETKAEVTKSHNGQLVQFKPDGSPYLMDNPLKAPTMKK